MSNMFFLVNFRDDENSPERSTLMNENKKNSHRKQG